MHDDPTSGRRFFRVLWLLLCVLGLSACAALHEIRPEVVTFGAWPAALHPGPYTFERLPSQESQADLQAQLESAAQPALADAGFTLAAQPLQAQYKVQLGQVVHYDPFGSPYGPYGPYANGPFFRFDRRYGGVYPMGGWWGPGAMESPYVLMQVSVLIRDAHSNQVLYESHASLDRAGVADPRLLVPLFRGAMQDFPIAPSGPHTVKVPLGDGGDAPHDPPLAPASAPQK